MSDDPNATDTSIESRVAAAADEYLEARERGEAPDVEAFLEQHPTLAPVLKDVLPALDAIGAIGNDEMPEQRGEPTRTRPIGDFLIQREIGRGGMGVVYEAEQLSLGRRVALKVLPFAAVLDPRQLERFKNEAQAAARLHHGNIVPVYSVGQDRGVHYYAMQYIEGLTVAQIVNELREREGRDQRRPDRVPDESSTAVDALTNGRSTASSRYCRAVARLGVQAARALDHAHEMGIVHRDIKPANLIVDLGGNLWITDFGLASFHGTETRSLTMSGDLLGTLRYMSPEQALAKRVPIDYRTDTYSLGVTLYEFLTLEPAITAKDSSEILQEIAFKEPRPARDLNRAIPEDVETILMKAMAKDPAERYATVRDMAEDLQRYLDGMPIEAKRPSLLKRASKWCGRHKVVVGAAGVLGVLSLVALGVSTVLVQSAYHEEAQQRARAEDNFDRARDAVDAMLTEVAAKELADLPGAAPVRRRLLEKAQAFYEDFLAEAGEPDVRLDAARAHARVGDIRALLEDNDAAEKSYRDALRLLVPPADQAPEAPANALVAMSVHRSLASVVNFTQGQTGLVEASHRDAVAIGERLVAEFPSGRLHWAELGHCYNDLGAFLLQDDGRYAEAEDPLRSAASTYDRLRIEQPGAPQYDHWFSSTQQNLAIAFAGLGRNAEAEETYRRLLDVRTGLLARFPGRPDLRLGLAEAYSNLGYLLAPPPLLPTALFTVSQRAGDFRTMAQAAETRVDAPDTSGVPNVNAFWARPRSERAAAACEAARSLLRSLINEFPDVSYYRGPYAEASITLATCQLQAGELGRAVETLRDATDEDPRQSHFLAHVLCETDDPSYRDVAESVRLAEQAVRLHPRTCCAWLVLGEARYRDGDWPGVIRALDEAAQRPHHSPAMIGFFRAMACWQLGDADGALRAFADAEAATGIGTPKYRVQWLPARAEAAELLGIEETSIEILDRHR